MNHQNITVLLIEDNPGDAHLIQLLLDDVSISASTGYTFELLLANRLAAGFEQLDRKTVDVILLDLTLPDSYGLDTFNRIYAHAPHIPTIILTGLDDDTVGFKAVQAGAQDYLIKGQLDEYVLQRVILYAIERHSLLIQLEEQTQAVLRSEVRFHKMIEHNADGIIIVDHTGNICFVNPAAEALFGRSADELLEQPFDFPLNTENLTELTITRPDQQEIVADMRVVEIDWENTEAFLVSLRDITPRKQAEVAIKQRNRELALLNQVIAASAAISFKPETVLEIVCRELVQTLNVARSSAFLYNAAKTEFRVVTEYEPEGKPAILGQTFPAGSASQHLLTHKEPLVMNDVLNDERMISFHNQFRQRGVRSMLMLPLMVAGDVWGALVLTDSETHHFTSEQINLAWSVAEQVAGALERTRLSKEHQRLSAALEQSAESVTIINTEGKIVYVNSAFEQLSGYTAAEVIGQSHFTLKSDHQQVWDTISAGRVWQNRVEKRKKDGSQYTVDVTISPVRDEDGNIINYVESGRDVTRELELEKQFRQAQKMEAVGRLAGGVAHDFNNILTVITGYTELLLLQYNHDKSLCKDLEQIRKSSERAANVVRQLLAFSRKQVLELKNLNLNEIVADIGKMLRRLIGEDINIVIHADPKLDIINADPTQIEQIIVNLAVNARDAMPQGGKLTIETANVELDESYSLEHVETKPGPYVMLAVSDSGVGMDAKTRASIFEPFFTTKEVGAGTGLGLATVYGIVKQSGGHIWVYSEVGRGTTFKLYFPRIGEADEVVQHAAISTHNYSGTETVMLVEDEELVREVAGRMLRSQGYTIVEAANGSEAIQICQNYRYPIHLLVTDLVMPGGISGKELADQLTSHHSGLKTLFMSGYTDSTLNAQGVLDENTAFIQKPFAPNSLIRKVREVLDK